MMELNGKSPFILWCLVVVAVMVMVLGGHEVSPCPASCSCSSFDPSTEGLCRGCPTGSAPSAALKVKCESAGLAELPPEVPSDVNWLDLSRNNITRLRPRTLSRIPGLVHLKLSQNNIRDIGDDAFHGLDNIQVLDLDLNDLSVLVQTTFAGAESVVHLDISGNRLENIDNVFSGLRDLSRLDLRNNRLTQLTQNSFRGLSSLRYLLLTSNRISHVDRRTFRPLEKLVFVVLKGNPIGDGPQFHVRFHFHSNFLTYLDVSECGFRDVPKGLPGSGRYLQLRRNNLTSLGRHSFVESPYLTILVLDENRIASIESGTFEHLTQLQQLWLNNNRISTIPAPVPASVERLLMDLNLVEELRSGTFPASSQMHTLSFMGNNVSSLSPEAFDSLEKLKTLDLGNNRIHRIHRRTFHRLRHLKILQLSGNPIQTLDPECFHGLESLATLSMAYVAPQRPAIRDSVFEELGQLSRLDLDSSPGLVGAIVASDRLLASLGRVQELSMRSSDLVRLRPDVLQSLRNLTTFRLSSARWRCDRALVWLRDWMASTALRLDDGADDNRCGSPRVLQGRSILSLKPHEFADIVDIHPSADTSDHDNYDDDDDYTTISIAAADVVITNTRPVVLLPGRAVTSGGQQPLPDEYGVDGLDSIYDGNSAGDPHKGSSSEPRFENDTTDYFRFARTSPESKTTIAARHHGNDDHPAVSYSRNTLAVVIATVAATLIVAVVIVVVIVHVTTDRRCRRTRDRKKTASEMTSSSKSGGGGGGGGVAIPYRHKNGILYYTPAGVGGMGGGSDSDAPDLIRKTASGEAMTLIPGRDFNHEGPIRVYKWEDF